MQSTLIRGLARGACLLLLCFPFNTAFALAIASNALTISNIQITPAVGSVVFSGPRDVSAIVSVAFNSLGENVSDGHFGTGVDVSADATINFATGLAEASDSAGTVSVSNAINLGGNSNAAGVSFPGSFSSLSGLFNFTGVSGMTDVSFSMDINGMLNGFADSVGSFENDFIASLEIDGENVLFSFSALVGGPDFAADTQFVSQTLSATVSLDTAATYSFVVSAQSNVEGSNSVPAPGTLALALIALTLLPVCSPTRGRQPRKRSTTSLCA